MPLSTPPRRAVRALLAWIVYVAILSCVHPAGSAAQQALRIQGSTTFYNHLLKPHIAQIEEAAGTPVEVVPNKSIWGVIALLEGRADLAMISATMAGEVEVARKIAPDLPYHRLKEFRISEVPISFPVHPRNPVRSLSNDQLRKIFNGEITRWSEVGGDDIPIRIVATQDGGGTVVAVRHQLLDDAPIRARDAIRPESARHVTQVVTQEPGAIGIAQQRLARSAGLPEIAIETPVVQTLTFIAAPPINEKLQALIEATRTIAAKDPL
ncbi:MAG TPA: substrate-binding domain-containing protein [Hyphomicrobium sp.]|mgnify:CR=1 FL=1|nr:substrate-binding domain-containing protein [Hyphomicrobium sp.]